MAAHDLLGKRGEAIAVELLLDFCGNNSPYFDPPIPTYLIGVDEPAHQAYIVSLPRGMRKGIARIPKTFPLNPENLSKLRAEVIERWDMLPTSAKISSFALEAGS